MTLPSQSDDALDAILSRARHLILDFNGPVCQLYTDQSEHLAADQLRAILARHHTGIPEAIAAATDPLAILAYAAAANPQLAEELDAELTRREYTAALTAQPAGYSHDLISSAREGHRTITVISTSSDIAIRAYLHTASLDEQVTAVIGRTGPSPDSATGHNLITRALKALRAEPAECALIAESADVLDQAAASGIAAIAYARTAAIRNLAAKRSWSAVSSLADLVLILRARPLPNYAVSESSRGRGRPAPSHTTGHAGPHPAVRQAVWLRRCQVWLRVFRPRWFQ